MTSLTLCLENSAVFDRFISVGHCTPMRACFIAVNMTPLGIARLVVSIGTMYPDLLPQNIFTL